MKAISPVIVGPRRRTPGLPAARSQNHGDPGHCDGDSGRLDHADPFAKDRGGERQAQDRNEKEEEAEPPNVFALHEPVPQPKRERGSHEGEEQKDRDESDGPVDRGLALEDGGGGGQRKGSDHELPPGHLDERVADL